MYKIKFKPFVLVVILLCGCGNFRSIPIDEGAQLSEPDVPIGTKFEPSNHFQVKLGEPISLKFSILTRYDIKYQGIDKVLDNNFEITYHGPMPKEVPRYLVKWNGQRYIKVDVFKVKLVPLHLGEFKVNLGKIKIRYRINENQEWSPERLFKTQDVYMKVN